MDKEKDHIVGQYKIGALVTVLGAEWDSYHPEVRMRLVGVIVDIDMVTKKYVVVWGDGLRREYEETTVMNSFPLLKYDET